MRSRGVREVKSWQRFSCNFDSFHVNFERACAARRESESERRERVCEKQERERVSFFLSFSLSPKNFRKKKKKLSNNGAPVVQLPFRMDDPPVLSGLLRSAPVVDSAREEEERCAEFELVFFWTCESR